MITVTQQAFYNIHFELNSNEFKLKDIYFTLNYT